MREDPQFVVNGSLTYKRSDAGLSLGVWVRNLTDELRSRSFTPSAQADRRIPDEPRVFGVRAGYKF